jgi:hypothetical protein
MNRRSLGVSYAIVTLALMAAIWVSGSCWQTENATGLRNMNRRDTCLAIWRVAVVALGLSQIAFATIAARTQRYLVLGLAVAVLLVLAALVLMLSRMPS